MQRSSTTLSRPQRRHFSCIGTHKCFRLFPFRETYQLRKLVGAMSELSTYERERLQRLEKNKEMLERLGLTGSSATALKDQIAGSCLSPGVRSKTQPSRKFRVHTGLYTRTGAPTKVQSKPERTQKPLKERTQKVPLAEPTRRSGRHAGKEPVKACRLSIEKRESLSLYSCQQRAHQIQLKLAPTNNNPHMCSIARWTAEKHRPRSLPRRE
jgi:hypothetical protein